MNPRELKWFVASCLRNELANADAFDAAKSSLVQQSIERGGDGVLRGTHPDVGQLDQIVRARSIYVLRCRERLEWRHELKPTRTDRWSLTFRILTPEALERIGRTKGD